MLSLRIPLIHHTPCKSTLHNSRSVVWCCNEDRPAGAQGTSRDLCLFGVYSYIRKASNSPNWWIAKISKSEIFWPKWHVWHHLGAAPLHVIASLLLPPCRCILSPAYTHVVVVKLMDHWCCWLCALALLGLQVTLPTSHMSTLKNQHQHVTLPQ